MNRLPPLDDDLDLLLAPARDIPPVAPGRHVAALDAVRASVARGTVESPSDAPAISTPAAGLSGWWYGAVGLLLGVGLGAFGAMQLAPTQSMASIHKRPVSPPATAVVIEHEVEREPDRAEPTVTEASSEPAQQTAPLATTPSALVQPPTAEADESPEGDDTLVDERRLIDVALAQANRGQHAAALTTLERHEARFPAGQLVQSREALRIRALHALGRASEATDRLERFERRYPSSLALPPLRNLVQAPND